VSLDLPAIGPSVVTLGVFDGVHLGHRAIVAATAAAAERAGAQATALVFDPPPVEVIRPGSRVSRLLPVDLVTSRLREAGIDHAVIVRFDEALRMLAPEAFLDALSPAIEVRGMVMAAGSAFGRDRAGTLERTTSIGHERGFAVAEAPVVTDAGEPVSSSRIRIALADGDVARAGRLLAAAPLLRGTVIRGDGRGRELGFPTANLRFAYTPALPALGIYVGRVDVPTRGVGPGHPALVSVGVRPTFHDHASVLVEAYLLDWSGDLYDAVLTVTLEERLREELRFASVDGLVEQMREDERAAREMLLGL
jgi:riboflavin kinase/FMN adenylyltransferase